MCWSTKRDRNTVNLHGCPGLSLVLPFHLSLPCFYMPVCYTPSLANLGSWVLGSGKSAVLSGSEGRDCAPEQQTSSKGAKPGWNQIQAARVVEGRKYLSSVLVQERRCLSCGSNSEAKIFLGPGEQWVALGGITQLSDALDGAFKMLELRLAVEKVLVARAEKCPTLMELIFKVQS